MTTASPPTLHPQTRGAWDRAVALHRARLSGDPVFLIPDGYDPDGYVRAFGMAALCALLGRRKPLAYNVRASARFRYRAGLTTSRYRSDPAGAPREAYGPDGRVRQDWIDENYDTIWNRTEESMARKTWMRVRGKWMLTPEAEYDIAIHAEKKRRAEEDRARQGRELQAIRDRLGARQRGADVETRARAYVATMDACSSADAAAAARVLVRGFALPEGVALAIFREDFIPRLQRKGKTTRRDIVGWIQRAGRSHLPLGYLLERKR